MTGWVVVALHVALVCLAVPMLSGLQHSVAMGRLAIGQPWRDLRRLWAKGAPVPPGSTALFGAAPALAAAGAGAALVLVPSFSLGAALAPVADLLLLFGVLALPRAALALGAADSGMPPRLDAALHLGPWPVLVLIAMAAFLLCGSTNLPAAAAAVRDGGMAARAAGALSGAALFAVLMAEPGLDARGLAGRHRALVHVATAMRGVAGLSAVAALALPFGMAAAEAGPGGWVLGAAAWALKLGVLGLVAGALGDRPTVSASSLLMPAAALLALMAVVVASVQGAA